MPQPRNSGKRTGSRTATRRSVREDADETEEEQDQSDEDLIQQVRAAVGRNGGNIEPVGLNYLRDLRRLRRLNRELKAQIAELEDEMPDGSLILVGDEATAMRSILETRKLDPKKLADLLAKLENDLATERTTNEGNTRKLLFSRIAENTGYNRDAVEIVANTGNLHIEEKEIEVDGVGADKGKKVKKMWPFVRPKGDDKAALVKLDDYVEANQKIMWPALKTGNGTQQGNTRSSGTTTAVVDGTSAPRDGVSGETNMVKEALERDKKKGEARGNPIDFLRGPAPTRAAVS